MQTGESFSGRERNCCFLNLGNAVFADVSSISGFNVKDDSRAIGTVDWDQDGDLDLWVSNRTSPRIRYFENTSDHASHSVFVRLQGTVSNRDAIGARVELQREAKPKPMLVRTVRAGSGFLSQSSSWLHFGLGESRGSCTLKIHWPGQSQPEIVRDIQPGRRYTIQQNGGVLSRLAFAKQRPSSASAIKVAPQSPTLRTLVLDRIPFPPITFRSPSEEPTTVDGRGVPTLINVWSVSCVPCIDEIKEFAEKRQRFKDMGLDILMLNADAAFDQRNSEASQLLSSLGADFPQGALNRDTLRIIDRFTKTYFELHEDLAVPTSFLLDKHGRVVSIYRGRATLDQIEQDMRLLDAPPATLLAALTELRGHWHRPPNPVPNILRVAEVLNDVGLEPSKYFHHCLDLNRGAAPDDPYRLRNRELADVHFAYGTELLKSGKSREAFEELNRAVQVDPEHSDAHTNIAAAFFQGKRWAQAEHHFELALRGDPKNVDLLVNRGLARRRQNKLQQAASDFRSALGQSPNDPRALFNLATIVQQQGEHREAAKLLKQLRDVTQAPP